MSEFYYDKWGDGSKTEGLPTKEESLRKWENGSKNGNGLIDDIMPFVIDRNAYPGRFDCFSDMLAPRENRIKCKDKYADNLFGTDVEYIGRKNKDIASNAQWQGSKWGNPHRSPYDINPVTGSNYTLNDAIDYYRSDILTGSCPAQDMGYKHDFPVPREDTVKRELKGKHLLCFCTSRGGGKGHRVHNDGEYTNNSCHGDILSHIANHM